MKAAAYRLLGALVVATCVTLGLAYCIGGCSPAAKTSEANVVRSNAYGLELEACLQKSKTQAEDDACTKDVDAKYGAKVKP